MLFFAMDSELFKTGSAIRLNEATQVISGLIL